MAHTLHQSLQHLSLHSPSSPIPSPSKQLHSSYDHSASSSLPSTTTSSPPSQHVSISNTPMYSHTTSHSTTTNTSPNRSVPMSLMTTPTMSQGTTPGVSPRRDEETYQNTYHSSSSSSPDSPISKPQPHPDRMMVRLLIDAKFSGSLIGKGGHIINQLRLDTEASIDIADAVRGAEHRLVTIKGSAPRTAQAILSISQRLAERRREQRRQEAQALAYPTDTIPDLDDGRINITLLVPNSQVGCLIGRSGASIKSSRETSGATIRVSDQVLDGSAEKSVFVDGSVTQVSLALDLICAQLYEARERAITRQLYQPRPQQHQPHQQQQQQQQQHMYDPYHGLPLDAYPLSSLPQLQMPQLQSLAQSSHHGHHASMSGNLNMGQHTLTHQQHHPHHQHQQQHPHAHMTGPMSQMSQMPTNQTMTSHHMGNAFGQHPHAAVGMPTMASPYQTTGINQMSSGPLAGYAHLHPSVSVALPSTSVPVTSSSTPQSSVTSPHTQHTTNPSLIEDRVETVSFTITNEFVGAILGRGGAVIREIRSRTPSHIRVSDPHPHTFERMVTVTGNKQNNEMAMALIQEKINQHEPQRSRRQ